MLASVVFLIGVAFSSNDCEMWAYEKTPKNLPKNGITPVMTKPKLYGEFVSREECNKAAQEDSSAVKNSCMLKNKCTGEVSVPVD